VSKPVWMLAACLIAGRAPAEEFSLMIGPPVAAQNYNAKNAAFVFRTKGCADPDKIEVNGTAEGLYNGVRKTLRLQRIGAVQPGVYSIFREWAAEGVWVVNLAARCTSAVAGALVPIGPNGFIRDSSKFFPRTPSEAEIEASLKALAKVGGESAPTTKK
jgi:hypothetical protein